MTISVDPETGNLLGQNTDDLYTWDEVARMRPPCPRCGTPISIRPMDSDSREDRGERRFYIGRHAFNRNRRSAPPKFPAWVWPICSLARAAGRA